MQTHASGARLPLASSPILGSAHGAALFAPSRLMVEPLLGVKRLLLDGETELGATVGAMDLLIPERHGQPSVVVALIPGGVSDRHRRLDAGIFQLRESDRSIFLIHENQAGYETGKFVLFKATVGGDDDAIAGAGTMGSRTVDADLAAGTGALDDVGGKPLSTSDVVDIHPFERPQVGGIHQITIQSQAAQIFDVLLISSVSAESGR